MDAVVAEDMVRMKIVFILYRKGGNECHRQGCGIYISLYSIPTKSIEERLYKPTFRGRTACHNGYGTKIGQRTTMICVQPGPSSEVRWYF